MLRISLTPGYSEYWLCGIERESLEIVCNQRWELYPFLKRVGKTWKGNSVKGKDSCGFEGEREEGNKR